MNCKLPRHSLICNSSFFYMLLIAPSLIPRLFNSNPRHLNSDPRLFNSDPRLSTQNHISPHEPIIIIRFAPNSKIRNPPKNKNRLYHYYYNYYYRIACFPAIPSFVILHSFIFFLLPRAWPGGMHEAVEYHQAEA